jgi:glyoxylase-like metal-dependent hydrolase (beta-lactamase superfamily II)
VYCPEREVLCCGDLFQWTAPDAGKLLKEERYVTENAELLEETAGLKPKVLLPGHGPKVTGKENVQEALSSSFIRHYRLRRDVSPERVVQINRNWMGTI